MGATRRLNVFGLIIFVAYNILLTILYLIYLILLKYKKPNKPKHMFEYILSLNVCLVMFTI
jgi:hypothetical protein